MDSDYKRLLKYLGIIFLSVLLTNKLPRDSYSIIQYIIRPIRFENSVLYLWGLIPLAMLLIGIKGLFKLKWFAEKSKLVIFIIVIIFVVPMMRSSLNSVKTSYFRMDNELRSIDFKDTNIKILEINDNEAVINVRLALADYGRDVNDFKVRMYLPESLGSCFNANFLEFGELYKTYGNKSELNIDKNITVKLANGTTVDDIMNTNWDWETFRYELYNDSSITELIYHGV